MKKVVFIIVSILILGMVVFVSISSYKTHAMKIKYEEAVAAAENKDFVTAKQLFSELPMDYQYEKKEWKTITVEDWLTSIEKCENSPFIGEWRAKNSQGTWKVDIYISVLDFSGVELSYFKSFTLPSGVRVSDFGDLYVYPDGVTASYSSSGENSNGRHYKLVLKNLNTIELYFDDELEVTLKK